MNIFLKSLKLENFKGIKDLHIDFEHDTKIFGANATGKTTIFDAFSWLLFDKDSNDKKDFGIKTYDSSGQTEKGVDHTVEGVLLVDDVKLTLRKTYKENWRKKRGSSVEEFTGHTTDYFINEVPQKLKDYQARINSIIPEERFQLLTNPMHFNQTLDYRKRREILLGLVEEVTLQDVVENNQALSPLLDFKMPVDDIKAMSKSTASKTNKQLEEIPIRIDELVKSKVDIDFSEKKKEREKFVAKLDEMRSKPAKARDIDLIQKITDLRVELAHIGQERALEKQKGEDQIKQAISELQNQLSQSDIEEKSIRNRLNETVASLRSKREQYLAISESSHDGTCPTCKQTWEAGLEEFNREKSERLSILSESGKELASQEEKERAHHEEVLSKIDQLKDELNARKQALLLYQKNSESEEPTHLKEQQTKLEAEIEKLQIRMEDIKEKEELHNTEIAAMEKVISDLDKELAFEEVNAAADQKIDEYKTKERELAKTYEDAMQILYMCEAYTRSHVATVQDRLNSKFESIRFKLFHQQINGGISDACEALIDGVPYSDANHAAKINSGLEVINTLAIHYKVSAPVFIDNAEAVNKLRDTVGQNIRLIVSEDPELIVDYPGEKDQKSYDLPF